MRQHSGKRPSPQLPEQAAVVLETTTCGVFKYGVPREQASVAKTWKEFEEIIQQQTGGLNFTAMITDVIVSALPNNAEALNDHFFLAPDEKSYRILLVMHRLYGNGKSGIRAQFGRDIAADSRRGETRKHP